MIAQHKQRQFNSSEEYITFLEQLKGRAALHQTITASAVTRTLDTMISNIKSDNKGENAKPWAEKVKAARLGDISAKAEVSRVRILRTTNFLIAMSNWAIFFNKVTLADGEVPYWENDGKQEVVISYSGADGKPRRSQILKYRDRTQINLFKISSEIVEYLLVDPYWGRIADETKALVDIARDLAVKIDQFLKPFVTGAIGAFTTTGAKASKTFDTHSVIATGNLPTTNALDVATSASSTKFSKSCMDAILRYGAGFGNLFGMVLKPESILIPSADSLGWLDDVTFTTQPNSIAEQILEGGHVTNYAGQNWNLIPDITLSPSAGFAYVKFSGRAAGEFYEKPTLAESRDLVTPESEQNNKGQMWQSNWVGACVPGPWKPFVLRVKYK